MLVLTSGGADSLVALDMILYDDAYAETDVETELMVINYGQKTWKKELECARNLATYYGRHLRIASLPSLQVQDKHRKDPNMFIPWRNLNLIACAASYAYTGEHKHIVHGANADDFEGYPDCRPEFFEALNKVLQIGAFEPVEVVFPLVNTKKNDVIAKGVMRKVPFKFSWSCYTNDEIACGKCTSCKYRAAGFEAAGVRDPIISI